ncbi:hypothetical protein JKP75_00650 [Blastococcus sp. TML/M2B]|uniref:hypothetical protein n=1 Tax=unclassified Blastococcus TaxID=2619396 RepID=UPI0019099484|nr:MULTISPECIES: hypothetical protein [unclassified Blastococcus]MBN1091232.1 hypothetical protein [Blastococcus sp. TML/M2B]MBN1095212.1 hypothetical protein [Blastococcus sp. TML/C7B]
MPWWAWVGIALGWVLLAIVAAVFLGASATVVRKEEERVFRFHDNESADWAGGTSSEVPDRWSRPAR